MDSRHVTLVANTVTTVTLSSDFNNVEVANISGGAAVYYLVNPGATNPTVKGNGTHVLPAAIGANSTSPHFGGGIATVVKLISAGTPDVAVTGW